MSCTTIASDRSTLYGVVGSAPGVALPVPNVAESGLALFQVVLRLVAVSTQLKSVVFHPPLPSSAELSPAVQSQTRLRVCASTPLPVPAHTSAAATAAEKRAAWGRDFICLLCL